MRLMWAAGVAKLSLSHCDGAACFSNPPFVHQLQWAPSGNLVTAVGDGSVRLLHVEESRAPRQLNGRKNRVRGVQHTLVEEGWARLHSSAAVQAQLCAWGGEYCVAGFIVRRVPALTTV